MNRASAISVLFQIFRQHDDAFAKYQEAARRTEDQKIGDYLQELANYHQEQSKKLERLLTDMSPSPAPMPDTEHRKALIHLQWTTFVSALDKQEHQPLLTLCHQNEEKVSQSYREGLSAHGLPAGIEEMLQELHQKQLQVVLQTERYETVQDIRPGNIHS